MSPLSELLSKDEEPAIQGIGVRRGLAFGLADERRRGLEEADAVIEEARPSILVSADVGDRA